jgi:AhpD family alkylhydroperoxidase
MRLSCLDGGHRLRARLFLRATSRDAPDVVRMLLYRPEFFARPLLALTVDAMRGPSYWTVGEREDIARRVAERHRCAFCLDSHTEMTRLVSHDPAETRPVADAPAAAVREAERVTLVWEIVNRLGNAFGFALRGDQVHTGTRALHRFGYRFPGFLLAGGKDAGHDDPVAELRHAVFEAAAVTPPELRRAAASGDLDEPWKSYTAMVRDASYRITDADIARLLAEHTEDEVFEMTVAAAVGAALKRYDADGY